MNLKNESTIIYNQKEIKKYLEIKSKDTRYV